jgi:hypothetical protein
MEFILAAIVLVIALAFLRTIIDSLIGLAALVNAIMSGQPKPAKRPHGNAFIGFLIVALAIGWGLA